MTQPRISAPFRTLAALTMGASCALALIGCATAGTPASPGASGSPEGGGEATPNAEVVETEPGECLIGSWYISEDEMQGFYDAIDTPAAFEVEGGTGLAFTADSYEYTPDFTLNMTIAGTEAAGTLVGSITGNYTSDGEQITTTNDASDISMTISTMGTTQDAGAAFNKFLGISPINTAPYHCEDGAPVIMFGTGDDKPRVAMRLVAAE